MKAVELLKIGRELLKVMSACDIYRDDWEYVELYERFLYLRSLGVKYGEAVRMLSEEKGVSQRTLERAIRRLERDC